MHLVPHISHPHVCTLHSQTSARVAIDVTSTQLLNGRSGRQMSTVGVGQRTLCFTHQSCLAWLSISGYCRWCGWAAGLHRRVPHNDRRCVNYRRAWHATCIRARYCLITGSHDIVSKLSFTAAKNPRIWIQTNCEKVWVTTLVTMWLTRTSRCRWWSLPAATMGNIWWGCRHPICQMHCLQLLT